MGPGINKTKITIAISLAVAGARSNITVSLW